MVNYWQVVMTLYDIFITIIEENGDVSEVDRRLEIHMYASKLEMHAQI